MNEAVGSVQSVDAIEKDGESVSDDRRHWVRCLGQANSEAASGE